MEKHLKYMLKLGKQKKDKKEKYNIKRKHMEVTKVTLNEKNKINNLYNIEPIEITIQEKQEENKPQKEETKYQKKKRKEREKRLKEKQKKEKNEKEKFDFDTEVVIGMTNNNKQHQKRQKQHIQEKAVTDKNERRRKKRNRRIKRIIKWTSIIVIIAGGTTFAMVSPIFNIQEIQVTGNEKISADTVISLSGLSKGQNIFRFLSSNIIEQIKTEAYIQNAEIKRSFPNKIIINVKERKQRFNVEFLNGYAYIDSQGYILEISSNKLELPTIQGISTPENEVVAGNRLNQEDLEKLEVALQIMDAYKSCDLDDRVTSIDISDKNNYSIYMESDKKTIYIGDGSSLGDKILWIQAILKDNEGVEGEIYVNGDLTGNFKPRFKAKV